MINVFHGSLRREAPLAGLVLVVGLSAAACSTPADSDDVQAGAPPYSQNINTWAMPVDQYLPQAQATVDYAENVLVSDCMADAGYTWTVAPYDINAPLAETTNVAGRQLFTEQIAAEWGYLAAPSTQANFAQQDAVAEQPLPQGSDDAFWGCVSQVRSDELPPASSEALNFAAALGMAADQAAQLDPKVMKAAEAWRECMKPMGISDLPGSPDDMPTASLKTEFGRDSSGEATLSTGVTASAREIEVATFDAACRTSTGWTEARYTAEWDRQTTTVRENADALQRVLEENQAVESRAVDVLVERGLG